MRDVRGKIDSEYDYDSEGKEEQRAKHKSDEATKNEDGSTEQRTKSKEQVTKERCEMRGSRRTVSSSQ